MEAAPEALRTKAVTPLPGRLVVGGGTALFLDGRCWGETAPLEEVEVSIGGQRHDVLGFGLAPPRMRGDDYWWAIVPVPRVERGQEARVALHARDRNGVRLEADLGSVHLEPALQRATASPAGAEDEQGPLVAICVATYEPDPHLFEQQIESIRAQEHRNWICLISDDASSPRSRAEIERVIDGDPRFELSVASSNGGFYANFERALAMVPPEADLVALGDQDDRWYPDKLARLIAGLQPGSGLVFSDMRVATDDGRVLADTYWGFRPVNHTDFASLVLANTVTGAACLFRASLLDDILPFPPRLGNAFHDHWIAQVAMALGPIDYIDAPLYDYMQHGEAALGYLQANGEGRYSAALSERAGIWFGRWKGRGFRLGWRVPYFRLYCRTRIATTALRLRLGERLSDERRGVLDAIEDSPGGMAWLARRGLRDLHGPTATIGRERVMLAGLAWRRAAVARRRVRAALSRVR